MWHSVACARLRTAKLACAVGNTIGSSVLQLVFLAAASLQFPPDLFSTLNSTMFECPCFPWILIGSCCHACPCATGEVYWPGFIRVHLVDQYRRHTLSNALRTEGR